MKQKKERIFYPVLQVRLSQDNIDWLKNKNKEFDSWNKFFNSLIEKYGRKNGKSL